MQRIVRRIGGRVVLALAVVGSMVPSAAFGTAEGGTSLTRATAGGLTWASADRADASTLTAERAARDAGYVDGEVLVRSPSSGRSTTPGRARAPQMPI